MKRAIALLAALVGSIGVASAAELCSAASDSNTGALVELYTSEGCDSCPPADRWLRALPEEAVRAGRIVPIALHVDYWDYIGWKDPFAKPIFTARQREWSRLARATVIYTPQVVLAGRDYRTWSSSRFDADVKRINETPARARVEVSIARDAADRLTVRGSAAVPLASDRADAMLYVALVESGLTSHVRAGENRGATLAHDHVAREWWGPIPMDADGRASLSGTAVGAGKGRFGAVAFVQDRRSGAILQALSCR